MRLNSVRLTVVILAAGLVAVAAGCGGGGSKSSSSTSSQMHETTATSSATTTSSSGSGTTFASAKNCQDLAGLAAKVAGAIEATSGNPANTLETEAKALQALANAAPSDIRGDFQTFATAFSNFLATLEKAGYKPGSTSPPTAAQIAALTKGAKAFESPKLTQAEQHLSAWAKQNCKGVKVGG